MVANRFTGLFRVMDKRPVIIRLIDPPLHEFLPNHGELLRELSDLKIRLQHAPDLKEIDLLLEQVRIKEQILKRVESRVTLRFSCRDHRENLVDFMISCWASKRAVEKSLNVFSVFPSVKFFATQVETTSDLETRVKGMFVAGDGPGVAGNIVSASATGLIPAKAIIAGGR